MSSSVASSSTFRPTFFGLFDRPATPERDIEAQTPSTIAITQPAPALTHSQRASLNADPVDPVDAFFGVSVPRSPAPISSSTTLAGTRDSRHDQLRQSTSLESDVLPPSYEDSLEPPSYTQVSDQPTLAMYLFKFGFLFPLFWIAGAFILLSPLRAPEDWESAKPELEREELIESMRRAEIKWARRCLCVLLVFVLLAIAAAISAFFIVRSS